MDLKSANSVLKAIHDGYVALAVMEGVVLAVMLLGRSPTGLGYLVGGFGLLGVAGGYAYAARRIGADSNLDASHAVWARSIRNYGICLAASSAVLVAVDYMDAVAGK